MRIMVLRSSRDGREGKRGFEQVVSLLLVTYLEGPGLILAVFRPSGKEIRGILSEGLLGDQKIAPSGSYTSAEGSPMESCDTKRHCRRRQTTALQPRA